MYKAKRGQKSKRAAWKDRGERRYFQAHCVAWGPSIAGLSRARASEASERVTPRTGALRKQWLALGGEYASLAMHRITWIHPRHAMTLNVERYLRMVARCDHSVY